MQDYIMQSPLNALIPMYTGIYTKRRFGGAESIQTGTLYVQTGLSQEKYFHLRS